MFQMMLIFVYTNANIRDIPSSDLKLTVFKWDSTVPFRFESDILSWDICVGKHPSGFEYDCEFGIGLGVLKNESIITKIYFKVKLDVKYWKKVITVM